jgi:putative hemolysin
MNPYAEISIILLLILINGFLSLSEMALVAARKVRLQQMVEDGDTRAATALRLTESPGRMLSTVQVGISLISILTGVFGGATLADRIAVVLVRWPLIEPYARPISLTFVVLIITYLSLILGELAPKRIALNGAERIARLVAPVMDLLSKIVSPLVSFLNASTNLVLRIIGAKPSTDSPVSDEEVRILIEQGTESGVFEPIEEEIVGQLFRLSDLTVDALLTPRTEVAWLDLDDTPAEIAAKLTSFAHSRFPVAEGSLDNVVGLVLVKDLFALSLLGRELDLRSVMQPPVFIPDSMPALEALERLRQTRTHIAMIIDEYGGLEGLVTLADFVEAIIGEVPDVGDLDDPDVVRRADGSYLLDGMTPIDRFQELFDIKDLPDENEGYYQTVGGFVMSMLGRVPNAGDSFDWSQLRFEVMDMDGRRVDKVLVAMVMEDEQE